MLFRRVRVCRFFGFDVNADASWFFLAVLISWTVAGNVFPSRYPDQALDLYQWMGVATVGGLIFSIIAHEVAHAVIAEYYKMPVTGITLFIFGGVAEMKGEPSHPRGEFFMAIAGPIMSALLGLFFWAVGDLYATVGGGPGAPYHILHYLGDLNMLIAIFNMLPAFPLDGGRALRAVLWKRYNNLVAATRVASKWGAAFAYGMIGFSCYEIVVTGDMVSGLWIGLLALFLHTAGEYAVKSTESRSLLSSETVEFFLQTSITTVSPDLTITELVDRHLSRHYQRVFPVLDGEKLAGVITLRSVLALERHKWQWLHVGSIMEEVTDNNTVPPDMPAADALEIMQKSGRELLLIKNKGYFLGVVAFRDLSSYLAINMRLDHNTPLRKSRTAE